MKEFRYTNRGPLLWAVVRTNLIRLEWEGDNLVVTRHYVSDNDVISDGIAHTFDDSHGNRICNHNVAKMIHWGCCGWSAGSHEIGQLIDIVTEFISKRPQTV